jgi:hypothetical protein
MRDLFIRGRPRAGRIGAIMVFALLLASLGGRPLSADELKKSGTVDIEQTQIAFIGSGNLGGGKLYFEGKTYSFTIGGLGIGGFGISRMTAVGTVFNLTDVSKFAGAYVQGRYGYAAGSSGSGELWLENDAGVVMQLKTQREGLALSLGGDAVYVRFD